MDHITHEMRLANWKSIIEQCHARPEGKTIKQWLSEQGIPEKQYYCIVRQLTGLFQRECIHDYLLRNVNIIKVIFPMEYHRLCIDFFEIKIDSISQLRF